MSNIVSLVAFVARLFLAPSQVEGELVVSGPMPVTAVYGEAVGPLLTQVGYDSYESEIPDFVDGPRRVGREKIVCHLLRFVEGMTFDQKIAEMDRHGFRQASFEELAAFSIAYPKERLKRNLVSFGSEWKTNDGRIYVPIIGAEVVPTSGGSFVQRFVGLVRRDFLWTEEIDGQIAVLVVRK